MVRTRVGYCGGTTLHPTYAQIGDHTEALQVDFDPEQIGYEELLQLFWSSREHTRDAFSTQYRAAIWAADPQQLELARATAEQLARDRGLPVTTAVEELGVFTLAEDYHQKYRLRREGALCDELVARYGSDEAMVMSTAAARINGLLGGYAKDRELAALLPLLALSPEGEKRLLARVH